MDDLLGEDWQKPAQPTKPNIAPSTNSFSSNYSSLRATPQLPLSRSASPQTTSRPSSTVNGSKTQANDSFGALLNLKSSKPGSSLSLLDKQKQILEEKRRQQDQQAQIWDTLGSRRGTPEIRQPSPATVSQEDEDDILAAFNKDAPVDKASHFAPPPSSGPTSGRGTPSMVTSPPIPSTTSTFDDDDDPFGLNMMPPKTNGHAKVSAISAQNNDDDILGDLGKPVSDLPPRRVTESSSFGKVNEDPPGDSSDEEDEPVTADKSLAELVEIGFPADTARIALSENGGNVQGAVGWLLQQAYEESRQKARNNSQQRSDRIPAERSPQRIQRSDREQVPAWAREDERSSSIHRQRNNASPAQGDKDASKVAQEIGTKFLKGANSLWKASQKQMAKTLSEFQQDSDASQPKWRQDLDADRSRSSSHRREELRQKQQRQESNFTDEAAMLDAPRERPHRASRSQREPLVEEPLYRERSTADPLSPRPSQQRPEPRPPPPAQDKRPAARLTRQAVEEESEQAYVSPARRKRTTPVPAAQPEPEVDLFSPASAQPAPVQPQRTAPPATKPIASSQPAPSAPKPTTPPRSIPTISPPALSTSAAHRKTGGEHFKRGDFAAAHESYTAALTPLPATHPIAIIVLTNRALTALKTGDAKTAVADADRALEIIGPGQGTNETIGLGSGEGGKDMKEFYGKALMRKAEALEHMEKYAEAATVWRLAAAAGVGGAISLRGRDRCEKAAVPKPPVSAAPRPPKSAPPSLARAPPSRSANPKPTATSAEAVSKLRQANAAAEKADDEKFALTDQVDAKLAAWRGGKTDNLRALLQSMDAVLWESAGWKKVGMSDLVMPNKVKIIYMKAIAKVHPDKIPQDATTEQRMISGAVFSTLNEAWDKFKNDNNL